MGEDRGIGVHQENRVQQGYFVRGTQCQFLENICLEDDLRTRIFGTFVVKFLACLAPRIFEHLENGIIVHF